VTHFADHRCAFSHTPVWGSGMTSKTDIVRLKAAMFA